MSIMEKLVEKSLGVLANAPACDLSLGNPDPNVLPLKRKEVLHG